MRPRSLRPQLKRDPLGSATRGLVRPVLKSNDLSLVESAQIALDADDIATVVSNANSAGLPAGPVTLAVVTDSDFDRALAVLQTLQRTPPRPWWEAPWGARVLVLVLVMLVVAVCGIMIFG